MEAITKVNSKREASLLEIFDYQPLLIPLLSADSIEEQTLAVEFLGQLFRADN